MVIGHEISHGFDDQGAQFDAQGRLNNWWTADDLKRFQGRTACVANQFDNYFIEPNIHHNGKLVLGESIGDLAGAKISYLAFQKAKRQHPQPTLDGFTPDQQFFIAWGQWRGDEIRPATQRKMVQGDPHPIAKYRVIGPLCRRSQWRLVANKGRRWCVRQRRGVRFGRHCDLEASCLCLCISPRRQRIHIRCSDCGASCRPNSGVKRWLRGFRHREVPQCVC